MDGKVILVVGQRGTGKTTYVKRLATMVHPDSLLLHDVGGQYKDIYKKPLIPFDEFTELCTKIEQGVFIFEEATIFVSHARNETITDFLVTSRYRENTIVLVFHSLRSVPWYILNLTNFIVLFKTKDPISLIEEKFQNPDFTEVFKRVNSDPNKYANVTFEF